MATITTEDRVNRQLANIVAEGRSPRARHSILAAQSDSGADAGDCSFPLLTTSLKKKCNLCTEEGKCYDILSVLLKC